MRFGGLKRLGLALVLGALAWTLLDRRRPRDTIAAPGPQGGGLAQDAVAASRSDVPRGYRTVAVALAIALVMALVGLGWHAAAQRAETRAIAVALTRGEPDHAPVLLARYGCGGCHTIPGAPGADGDVGPDLAGLRERVYVGGVLQNTPANLIGWIVDPQRFSPHSAMPATGITEAEARDVAAYLYTH